METSCQNCVFAQYEGKVQKDCAAGLIDKYNSTGHVTECYNELGDFFVINRICLTKRKKDWVDKQNEKDIDKLLNIARKEIELKILYILVIKDEVSVQRYKYLIESVAKQVIKPKRLIVVVKTTDVLAKDVLGFLQDLNPPFAYTIREVIDKDESFDETINSIIRSCDFKKEQYYTVFTRADINDYWSESINERVVNNGENVIYEEYGSLEDYLASTYVHKTINCNPRYFLEMVKEENNAE